MLSREKLISSNEYLLERFQNEFFEKVISYMEKHNMSRKELAEKLGVSKGYVSQILNGDTDFRLSTIFKIALKIGVIPNIIFESIEDYIERDKQTSCDLKTSSQPFQKSLYQLHLMADFNLNFNRRQDSPTTFLSVKKDTFSKTISGLKSDESIHWQKTSEKKSLVANEF